jgi:metallophosphoesterase (TIGR00282 family)
MKLLFIGDVVDRPAAIWCAGCCPPIKGRRKIDLVVANGENSAEGNGILPHSANHLYDSGVDVITTGNHALRRREIFDYMEETPSLIRPYNFHSEAPGRGLYLHDAIRCQFCIINLQGVAFMEPLRNPYEAIEEAIAQAGTRNILVDFHAEATAEKLALAHYLDGKVTAVIGTHTHVQTADERVLPHGTGYITDAGMCGGRNSVLGVCRACHPAHANRPAGAL